MTTNPQLRTTRPPPAGSGALLVIVGLVLLIAGLLYVALGSLQSDGEGLWQRAREWFAARDTPTEEPQPAPARTPGAPVVSSASGDSPTTAPVAAAAAPAAGSLRLAVSTCVPSLLSLAENVRIVAVDASPTNVDFVQESAGTPNRFVRVSCDMRGESSSLAESGRMVVPPMVGDARNLPRKLIEAAKLDFDWFEARVHAADKAMDQIARVEVSYVAGHGLMTRVTDATGARVLLDERKRVLPANTPFPQVQRMTELDDAAAQRGYRDQGEIVWSGGVGDSFGQMQSKYFPRGQRFYSLEFVGRRATATVPARGKSGVDAITIDEYGDKQAPEASQRYATTCERDFGFVDARKALDAAMKQRHETPAQFEEHSFEYAIIDCLDDKVGPAWRFGGG